MPPLFGFNTSPQDVQYCSFRRLQRSKSRARDDFACPRNHARENFRWGLVSERSPLIMRALPFRYHDSSLRAWIARRSGATIPGLPAESVGHRSLTICLKQLVWALARAIVPEPTLTGACTPRFRLEKAHSLYVLFLY